MLYILLVLNLIIQPAILSEDENDSDGDLGGNLVSELKNDANLDLSVDEEYEDLRAEFLAYHTALASLAGGETSRRSMISTPCWQLGGICIHRNLCTGFKSLTQVPGCKDKLKVCCFVWNRYNVRDMREHDIDTPALPWSTHKQFGGKGVLEKTPIVNPGDRKKKKKKGKDKKENKSDSLVKAIVFLRTNNNWRI